MAVEQDNPSRENRKLEERTLEQHWPLPECHGNDDDLGLGKTNDNEDYSLTIVVAHSGQYLPFVL